MTATRGLEGIVATTSSVSSIIDDTLTYVGYNIDDLTEKATFEEIVYLLWHLKAPNEQELSELKRDSMKMLIFRKRSLSTLNLIRWMGFIQCLRFVQRYPY